MSHAEAGFENQNQNQPTTDAPNNFYESVSNYFTSESFNNTFNSVKESISATADQFLPGLDLNFGPAGGEATGGETSQLKSDHPQSSSQEPMKGQPERESTARSSDSAFPDKSKSPEPITGDQRSDQSNADASNKSLPKGDRPELKSKRAAPEAETTQTQPLIAETIAHQLDQDGDLSAGARELLDTIHRTMGAEAAAQTIANVNLNLISMGSDYRLRQEGDGITPMSGETRVGTTHQFYSPKQSNQEN